jgi:hypothetical protein
MPKIKVQMLKSKVSYDPEWGLRTRTPEGQDENPNGQPAKVGVRFIFNLKPEKCD